MDFSKQLPIPIRVTQASLNQTAFDFPRNIKNIFDAIDEAVRQKSDVLALEELALTGYDAGDDFQKSDNALIAELLHDIARYAYEKDPNLIISIGHPWFLAQKDFPAQTGLESERRKNALYNRINLPFNVQSFLGHGRILSMTAKSYLFNYERGYEKRYFAEWSAEDAEKFGGRFGTIDISFPDQAEKVPFGRPIIHITSDKGDINLTHVICEEKWVASRHDDGDGTDKDYERDGLVPSISRRVGKDGLVTIISDASPPMALKINKHIHLVKLASNYADAIVNTDGLGSSGSTFAQQGHRLIAQNGKITSYGGRLSFKRAATNSRTFFVTGAAQNSEAQTHLFIAHDFAVPQYLKKEMPVFAAETWDNPANPALEAEETVRMAALWLFDYMRKTRSQGIVEALSGGMDSAFNSTIVAAMVRLGITELGVDGFCREMSHLRYKQDILDAGKESVDAAINSCMQHMLTAVYMGTNNSSDETRNAARMLIEGGVWKGQKVEGIGGKFMERNVQDLIDFYAAIYAIENTTKLDDGERTDLLKELSTLFNLRPGSLSPDDYAAIIADLKQHYPELTGDFLSAANPRHTLAYENIQARARQALIMMFANAENKMAIANPNLDEARNSYATFGGDLHSGTINLNAFINKAKEIQLMKYLATEGLHGIGTFSGLLPALGNEPTAELLPKDAAGRVVQNDQDALQRSFDQMNTISELMLETRTGQYGERRLNPAEVFDACIKDPLFEDCSTNKLHNMVRLSYQRWWISQHKIHASPITPTHGHNVDHQTSLRTPNISGQDRAQLTQLGIHLLFDIAAKECANNKIWDSGNEAIWQKRALLDEDFVNHFEAVLTMHATKQLTFNLEALYQSVRLDGLETLFGPVDPLYSFLSRKTLEPCVA